jgi:hypothetical protein
MPAFCRICQEENKQSNAYVSCNNCGSFACEDHSTFFDTSKNAFCTVCFPRVVQNSASNVANAASTMSKQDNIEIFAALANRINEDEQITSLLRKPYFNGNLSLIERLMKRLAEIMSQYDNTSSNSNR